MNIETWADRIVIDTTGCWEHETKPNPRHGYREVEIHGVRWRAHRLVYEWLVGPIPKGLVIDHLCFNKSCLNPSHMVSL